MSSRVGTFIRCSAEYIVSVLPSGTRKSFSPTERSVGVLKLPALASGLCAIHFAGFPNTARPSSARDGRCRR